MAKKNMQEQFVEWLGELAAAGWQKSDRKGFGRKLWLRKNGTMLGLAGSRGAVTVVDVKTQRVKQFMSWQDFKAQELPIW